MGYTKKGGRTDFWPDNTDDTLYINASYGGESFLSLQDQAECHFGDRYDVEKIGIEVENIHTYSIYYDLYDSSDHTLFYVLTLTN
jgi:hypothetical protein